MKAFAVAALLAIPLLWVALSNGVDASTTSRTLTISTATSHPDVAFQGFDGNPPKLFDFNHDGRMEIVAQNDNQYVYVFDSQSGAILAQLRTTLPAGWGARSFNGPEVAIFDDAGTVRLIVQNSAAFVTSFRLDLASSTSTHLVLVKEWERHLDDCHTSPGSDSKPVLADLDKDGHYEIVASTEENGLYALRETGQLYWKACLGGGNAEPTVADINLDGYPDVVFGSDGGVVSALNGRTGAYLWSYAVKAHFNLQSGSMPVGVAVGQLDGKGGPDVVVGARDSHDAVNWTNDHALLLALDSGGHLLWAHQDPQGNPLTYTHAIIVDADKDGKPEVYWGDWNTIGHKPPNNEADSWKVTGPAHVYRYEANGNLTWKQTLPTYWSNKDLAVADVNGDGVQDVLANGPGPGGDGIWYLDSRTGAKQTFVGTSPWKVARAPVVADLWSTGTMQWVVEVGAADSSVSGGGLLVYDTHAPYSAAWPHLPDPKPLSIPPPPPPPGPAFNATFKLTNPNAYWEQVDVTPHPARTVAGVQVRVSGDAWHGMTKNQWGAWTASIHAVAGSAVEFLASDPSGGQSQSAVFHWLDGNLSKESVAPGTPPPPPPPPPYTPTFTPGDQTNAWWVEVRVSGGVVASVDARTNGGAWTSLPATSWGSWAKSYFVPHGSLVQFRATDNLGNTALSGSYTWG